MHRASPPDAGYLPRSRAPLRPSGSAAPFLGQSRPAELFRTCLIVPIVVVISVVLGYPLYRLVKLSLQRYGLPELIRHQGVYIGLAQLPPRAARPGLLAHARPHCDLHGCNVGMTMTLGMLLALLLVRVSTFVRILLSSGLVLVWSMPHVVAVQVWYWMTNYQNGVVNYILTKLQFGDYYQHDWYATTFSQFSIVTR